MNFSDAEKELLKFVAASDNPSSIQLPRELREKVAQAMGLDLSKWGNPSFNQAFNDGFGAFANQQGITPAAQGELYKGTLISPEGQAGMELSPEGTWRFAGPTPPGAIGSNTPGEPGFPTVDPFAREGVNIGQAVQAGAQVPLGTVGDLGATIQPIGTPQSLTPTSAVPSSQFQALYEQLEQYLEELERRGQVLNPNVELTPEKIAEFLKQAETEINPYFSSQLKLARDSLLTGVGYSRDQLIRFESDLERKYGQTLRGIGESAAEKGFALSGLRGREETDLATDTQRQIEENRRQLQFGSGQRARTFAQQFGTAELPQISIGEIPQVTAGQYGFGRPAGSLPLYELSPEVYSGLIGEQEFARRGAIQGRTSELESAFRTQQAINQARQLVL